jgi:hypothetical protein
MKGKTHKLTARSLVPVCSPYILVFLIKNYFKKTSCIILLLNTRIKKKVMLEWWLSGLVIRTSRHALGLRMSKYFIRRHAGLDRRCVWIGGEHRGIRPQISNVASFNDFLDSCLSQYLAFQML